MKNIKRRSISMILAATLFFGMTYSNVYADDEIQETYEEEVEEDQNYAQIICPVCGTSYQEFVENSRFGCPDCYEMFDLLMRDSIKHLQGSETHKGKRPKYGLKIVPEGLAAELPGSTETRHQAAAQEGSPAPARSREEELRDLKVRLRQAIYEEAYERAAEYRDQIRKLEKEGGADA